MPMSVRGGMATKGIYGWHDDDCGVARGVNVVIATAMYGLVVVKPKMPLSCSNKWG